MIDLHIHLDGSLSPKTIIKLAKSQNITLPSYDEEELLKYLCVSKSCQSLNDYLQCFTLPKLLLQTKESISTAIYELTAELKNQGLEYGEIRFAPQFHTQSGLCQREVVQATLDGLNNCGFMANLILCCMRGEDNYTQNMQTVEVAKTFLNKGVCAIDLAGAEGLYKTRDFQEIFQYAKKLEIPFTIHAGEADDASSVKDAINFGAKRIGHGIHAVDSEKVMKMLKDNKIYLEMCPTSNFQTKAVNNINEYPLRKFMDYGILVTINTDNTTVSQTTLKDEFEFIKRNFSITKNDIKRLNLNAIDGSFANEKTKQYLRERLLTNNNS